MPYIQRTGGIISGVFALEQTPGQEFLADDAAEVVAFRVPTAQQMLNRLRAEAAALIDSTQDRNARVFRAFVLVLLDELNAHAVKINAILTAIDNGVNLAAVKANVAAIADYPTRTATQVRNAITGKIDDGSADS